MNLFGRKIMHPSGDVHGKMAELLERSWQFEEELSNCFPDSDPILVYQSPECGLALASLMLSIEHASVLRSAFALTAPNSAASLLRLQFETLVRAAWLLFAATPEEIGKLQGSLDPDSQKRAEKLPNLQKMLAAVERKAPRGLSTPLVEFNSYHRQPLNSFVHGGVHALRRREGGFPVELATQLIKMSNALIHLAFRILADLGGGTRMSAVTNLYMPFNDCLPIFKTEVGNAV